MKFRIRYLDPETQEYIVSIREFGNTNNIPAAEWAEDWAYAAADKGPYTIEELHNEP